MWQYSQALPSAVALYESKVRLLKGRNRLWADACITELKVSSYGAEQQFRELDTILARCLSFQEFQGLPVNV